MLLLFRGSRFVYQAYQGRFLLLAVKKGRIVRINLVLSNHNYRSVPVGDCKGRVPPFQFVAT